MATSGLSNDIRNFQCVTVASVDVIKLPLSDILASHIKPVDLYHKIKSCSTLKLRPDQLKICSIPPPGVPDYNKFDVTLLYTLIRNLCSLPCPAQGWGNEPRTKDTQISDDIERLRLFRNNYYAHAESAVISDAVFKDVWRDLKLVFRRIKPKTGCSVDYEEQLINIERTKLTDDYLTTFRVLLETFAKLEKQTDARDEPYIFIHGENEILCGGTGQFKADVKNVESSCWSIIWQKHRGDVIKRIDTSTEKYSGSTKKTLVIKDVCKEDEGEYRALLLFESNGPEYKSKNTIRLYATGEMPFLSILEVTSGSEGITIHYNCGVPDELPKVDNIKWCKDGKQLDRKSKKYDKGDVNDSHLIINSPAFEDRGDYSCKVTNAVGTVTRNIMLDVPKVELLIDSPVCFGSETTIKSVILSTPTPTKIEWQKSKDKINFQSIEKPIYFGSSDNFKCPFLVITNADFIDKGYYSLLVWNAIGMNTRSFVFLNVTGSSPNITTSLETNIKSRSVKLIGNVLIYDDSPDILESFWIRNDETINFEDSDRKLLEGNIDNPSLTLENVSPDDAGEYKLTAINAVGLSTSEVIILDVPRVFEKKIEVENDGGQSITLTIKSFPAPYHVQWTAKRKDGDSFTPIDINAKEYEGTKVNFPHPVLVVRQKDLFEKNCFRIEVTNFIGKTAQEISGKYNPTKRRKRDSVENTIYSDDGAGFTFTKLNNNIVKQFPPQKLKTLKFSIKNSNKVTNIASIMKANSTLECIEILRDEDLFNDMDVIFMQFLCEEADCFDLNEKCIEYAEKQKALCYFKKPTVNGYKDVQFHVRGNLSGYTKAYIQHVMKTVAAILECKKEDILLNGVRHSTSFLLSLPVKNAYLWKLSAMNEQDWLKLHRLNIDYLIIDDEEISLKKQEGSEHPIQNCFTKYKKHSSKMCEDYCENCNMFICLQCASSIEHSSHKLVPIVEKIEVQKNAIQGDLRELESLIFPMYKEIADQIPYQKHELNENSQKLSTAINKYGEDLHREVDTAIKKLKSDIDIIDSKSLAVLNKQEDEIKHSISEITQCIADLNELLVSNNINLVSAYKSRNAKFRNLPPKVTVTLPRFTPKKINQEQICQQFGFQTELPTKTEEEHGHTSDPPGDEFSLQNKLLITEPKIMDMKTDYVESCNVSRPLVDEPRITTFIETDYVGLRTVSCLSDDKIWICGNDKVMRLYNLKGELVKSIQTKSGNRPWDIAITRSGDLVYTDEDDRTMNIVKETHIECVLKQQDWIPRFVCGTSDGELLVVMDSEIWNQTKVLRYSDSTVKQSIQYDDEGQPLYSSSIYAKHVSENKNLDICVADLYGHAVVVVNQAGKFRFTYTGSHSTLNRSFKPYGITTDSQSRILITESITICFHILDKDGQLLRYLDDFVLDHPKGICVDTSDNLFVAERDTGKVKKIQYCK